MFNPHHPSDRDRDDAATPDFSRSDKEVPLDSRSREIADAVHDWLDGSAPERDARRVASSHNVDFWKQLDNDLAQRRRMRTPVGLSARIMSAIPMEAPVAIAPWWRREFLVTPPAAIVTLAAMMALSALATAAVLR